MIKFTKKQILRLLKIDFVRFCIVGGTGFVINFALLTIFVKLFNWPVFVSQFIGAEVALFSNFMLHHKWTYKGHNVPKSKLKLITQFHATTWPAIIGSTLMVTFGVKILHLGELESLVIASAIALLWNFIWSKYVVWRDISSKEIEDISK